MSRRRNQAQKTTTFAPTTTTFEPTTTTFAPTTTTFAPTTTTFEPTTTTFAPTTTTFEPTTTTPVPIPANVATKGDLAVYALISNLANYQPKGDYALNSALSEYQPKGDYQKKGESVNVASGQAVNIRDQWHGMVYNQSVDGPHIYGYGGGKLGTTNHGGTKDALAWNSQGEVIVNSGGNPIKFGSQWKGEYYHQNKPTNNAYILNDTFDFKSLMLVGNAGTDGRRKVGVWDDLYVDGNATIQGKICNTSGKCLNPDLFNS